MTFLDTADAYCLDDSKVGHNERLVARAPSHMASSSSPIGRLAAADGSLVGRRPVLQRARDDGWLLLGLA